MSAAPKMTIRQIASAAGCDHDTVRIIAKRIYPDIVQNGKRTEFTEAEAFAIMAELPKRNMVGQPAGNPAGKLPETRPACRRGPRMRRRREEEATLCPLFLNRRLKARMKLYNNEKKDHLSENALRVEMIIEYLENHSARVPSDEEIREVLG